MTSEQLLEQIRVSKIVDGVDVKLSDTADKLNSRDACGGAVLAKAFDASAKDLSLEQLREIFGARGERYLSIIPYTVVALSLALAF